ncbi:MAG: ATP-binding protein [Bacteroidota bacterium]
MKRILALIAFCVPIFCSGQYLNPWNNIGIEEGFSNLTINDIEQDSTGYLWVATNEGFNRFDGEFVRRFPINDSLNLRHLPINDMVIDGSVIWLAIKGKGLYKYNILTDKSDKVAGLTNIDVYKLRLIGEDLWILTPRNGLIIYHKNEKRIRSYFDRKNNIIDAIPLNQDSMICSLVGVGLFKLSIQNDTLDRALDVQNVLGTQPSYTCHKLIAINEKIVAGCWDNALRILNGADFSEILFPEEDQLNYQGEELNVLASVEDQLIIGLKSGKLYWFDPRTLKFTFVDKSGFEGEQIRCIFVDQEKRIWVGTEQGVNYMNTTQPLFNIVELKSPLGKSLKVNVLEKVDETVWAGTDNGVFILNGKDSKWERSILANHRIYSLLPFKDRLFIGTATTVFEYNKTTGSLQDIFKSPLAIPEKNPFVPGALKYSRYVSLAVQNTPYGELLFASAYGYCLVFYHIEEQWHSFALFDGFVKESLFNDVVVGKTKQLYLAGEQDGLFENVTLDFKTCGDDEFFRSLSLRQKCAIEFASLNCKKEYTSRTIPAMVTNTIRSIDVDSNGNILFSSPNGLYEIGEQVSRMEMPFNEIKSFALKDNTIWSVSNNGLQFASRDGSSRFFAESEGIPKTGLSGPIVMNGDLLYLGGNGFLATASLRELSNVNQEVQSLNLTEIFMLGNKKRPKFKNQTYYIHENDYGLSLTFAVIDFNTASKNTFAYKIPGLYDFWIENDNTNEILLPGLRGGRYELVVKAMDHNGIQISEEKSIQIKVNRSWYKQLWFRITVLFLGMGLVWYWIYNKQNERRRILSMRENISRDLHDDVGSLLGSISIYTAAADNALQMGNQDETKSILNIIGDHSRSMIDRMSDIVWSINSDYDSLENLILKMKIYAQKIFQVKGIEAYFSIQEDIGSKELSMIKRKNIYLIYKEAIHNILKHSEASEVRIEIKRASGRLYFRIQDNGKGMNTAQLGRGIGNGLRSMKARAREIKGKLTIESEEGKGSTIQLIV